MLEKAIHENVKPTHIIDDFLENFIENMLEETRTTTNAETTSSTQAAEPAAPAALACTAPAIVYTPARTPVRSKLGLSGTPSRALRSQFDDAADVVVTGAAAPEASDAEVDSAALGSTIKLATVIVDNQVTATPVRRSARKVQGTDEEATLGDRKAVLSLLHATNFQFAPNPSLSSRDNTALRSPKVASSSVPCTLRADLRTGVAVT